MSNIAKQGLRLWGVDARSSTRPARSLSHGGVKAFEPRGSIRYASTLESGFGLGVSWVNLLNLLDAAKAGVLGTTANTEQSLATQSFRKGEVCTPEVLLNEVRPFSSAISSSSQLAAVLGVLSQRSKHLTTR